MQVDPPTGAFRVHEPPFVRSQLEIDIKLNEVGATGENVTMHQRFFIVSVVGIVHKILGLEPIT